MPTIETLTALLLAYRYIVIVPLSWIAQPLVAMLSGLLARLGYFDVFVLYVVLVATAVAGDILWYWVGYRFGDRLVGRFGKYLSITAQHVTSVKKIFHRYHASILLLSKLTNGVGFANVVLFTAGLTRVPFWTFVFFNIVGESIWSGMVVSIGYFLGHAYVTVNDVLGRIFITAAVVILALVAFGFANYLRKRIMRETETEESV